MHANGSRVMKLVYEIDLYDHPGCTCPAPPDEDLMLRVGMKENYNLAGRSAEMNGQMLIWGRGFSESIMGRMEFARRGTFHALSASSSLSMSESGHPGRVSYSSDGTPVRDSVAQTIEPRSETVVFEIPKWSGECLGQQSPADLRHIKPVGSMYLTCRCTRPESRKRFRGFRMVRLKRLAHGIILSSST